MITPVAILKQLLELDRYTSRLDAHRMDKEGLYHYMISLLSIENIQTINSFHEESVNKEIIQTTLNTGNHLPQNNAKDIAERLRRIAVGNIALNDSIDRFLYRAETNAWWEKRRVWIIAIVVALLCLGIVMAAKM